MLFASTCPGCGKRGPAPCDRCRASLVAAAPLPPLAGVEAAVAAFRYEGKARVLLLACKYRNRRDALPWLSAVLAGRVAAAGWPVDVVTWAPTSGSRRRSRGFDQSELIARSVGRRLRRPVRRLLVRAAGGAQTGRSAADRRTSVAFRSAPVPRRRVLVVDDVLTTGSTAEAAARALRAVGALAVHVAVVAHNP